MTVSMIGYTPEYLVGLRKIKLTISASREAIGMAQKHGHPIQSTTFLAFYIHVKYTCPNIEVMCIVKFQYATSAMLALPYDHFLVSLLFLDVPITVTVPSLLLTSFVNVSI